MRKILADSLQFTAGPVPWDASVRYVLALAVPVCAGLALGEVSFGVIGSIGALMAFFGDVGGPPSERLGSMLTGVVVQTDRRGHRLRACGGAPLRRRCGACRGRARGVAVQLASGVRERGPSIRDRTRDWPVSPDVRGCAPGTRRRIPGWRSAVGHGERGGHRVARQREATGPTLARRMESGTQRTGGRFALRGVPGAHDSGRARGGGLSRCAARILGDADRARGDASGCARGHAARGAAARRNRSGHSRRVGRGEDRYQPLGAAGTVALFAALIRPAGVRNYGFAVMMISALVMILLDIGFLARGGDAALLEVRLYDTLIGCAFAIAGTLVAYPEMWKKSSIA